MNKPTPRTKRFQQLRWKLTLTYTAVTVSAMITVEFLLLVIIGVGVVFLTNSGYLPEQLIQADSADYAPVLQFYLAQNPPNQEGIAEWLEAVGAASNVTLPLTFEATDEMLVVENNGILLAVKPPNLLGEDVIGKPFNGSMIPGLAEPLQAALQGTKDPKNLYRLDKNERKVILAFPIREQGHQDVLGVFVAIGELPTVWSQMGELLPIVSGSLLFFTIVAGLMGTVYGFLAARGPVQRLDRLAEASLAWSNGDFTVRVEDPSGDELGQLAYRLNEMSLQLDGMMETRRELAVVEERNRLARDLHDSAKQQAFAASAQISTARKLINTDPQAAEKHILEAERVTLALRQELTSLIQQLRPAALEGKGLAAALYEYTQEWSRQNGIAADVRVQRQRALDLEIEQNVFRIVQEALSNIARHSNASQVDIEIIYRKNDITSSIRDNGSGFDPASVNKGFGIQSMSERTERFGGTLLIESKQGAGTTISIKLPINGSSVSDLEDINA
jgi:NarL family two-component system sensor histidine kinase LiaS